MSFKDEGYSGKNVAFLGGSFNPPHLGHLFIAQSILREFRLDEVVLLPLGTPPHKNWIASGEDRRNMCELLVKDVPGLKVSSIELEREGYTYTIDTLRFLRENYEMASLNYIIGTDTLFNIESWYHYESLLSMADDFICVPRPGDDMDKAGQKLNELTSKYDCRITISRFYGPDISSTEVRERIEKGQDVSRFLSPEVETYIKERHIYD